MVDRALVAAKVAAVRDAVARIRSVLPTKEVFLADRTLREVVVFNLFVALQDCLSMAAHWLADEGWDVPRTYREVFIALADHGALPRDLSLRMAAASGLRNLVAHQYGVLDWERIHAAAGELGDLLAFCDVLARKVGSG